MLLPAVKLAGGVLNLMVGLTDRHVSTLLCCCCFLAEFIEHVVGGLKYNDVNVQLASVYVCIQLYSLTPSRQLSRHALHHPRLTQKLVHDLLHLLEHTNHSALISSLVGL